MARVFGNINNTREKNSIAKMQEKDPWDRGLLFTWYNYRVYRADKFCQSGNNTIILKLPFEWCFMLCKPDFCINFSSSQFMNLHARVDYANLRKANFALVNRARFYIFCWQFASSQMG